MSGIVFANPQTVQLSPGRVELRPDTELLPDGFMSGNLAP